MSIKIRWVLRIALSVLCALAVGFILYNSIQTAEQSAEQSSTVVEVVQETVAVIAPQSPIVTATGEAYDRLHEAVRTLAHFSEYALLGALGGWCCLSYTFRRRFLYIPAGGGVVLAVVDEILQHFTVGRAMEFFDVMVDVSGGLGGLAFAVFCVWVVIKILERKRNGTRELGNSPDEIQQKDLV